MKKIRTPFRKKSSNLVPSGENFQMELIGGDFVSQALS